MIVEVTRYVESLRESVTICFFMTEEEYAQGEAVRWDESFEPHCPLSKADRAFIRDGVLLTVKVTP